MMKKRLVLILILAMVLICSSLIALAGDNEVGSAGKETLPVAGLQPVVRDEMGVVEPVDNPWPGIERILGLVRDGRFYPILFEEGVVSEKPVRLTGIQMQEAISPESHELELYELEGRAVMVEGLNGGGWIYHAIIVDIGGPIITEVVKRVFLHGDMPEE